MDAREPVDPVQADAADGAGDAHERAPDSTADVGPDDRRDGSPDDLSIDMTDELIDLLGRDNPFSTGGSMGGSTGSPGVGSEPGAHQVAPPSAQALDLTAVQLDSSDPTGPGFLPARRVRRPVRWWVRRLVPSAVLVALAVGAGALLTAHHLPGWIVGLAVGLIAVAGSAAIWFDSSRH